MWSGNTFRMELDCSFVKEKSHSFIFNKIFYLVFFSIFKKIIIYSIIAVPLFSSEEIEMKFENSFRQLMHSLIQLGASELRIEETKKFSSLSLLLSNVGLLLGLYLFLGRFLLYASHNIF